MYLPPSLILLFMQKLKYSAGAQESFLNSLEDFSMHASLSTSTRELEEQLLRH